MIAKKDDEHCDRWISIDLHVHSIHSGGGLTPREILEATQRRFLDAVAITDHFAIRGALEAREISLHNASLPIGIIAQEISGGDHFHLLLLGTAENQVHFNRRRLMDQIADHHATGGITILAHPWTITRNQRAKSCVMELIHANLLDGVEFFNASLLEIPAHAGGIEAIFQAFWEDWVMPHHLAVTGGSDFHHCHGKREIGMGRTYLKVNRVDEAGIFEALRARRCVAGLTSDSVIAVSGVQEQSPLLWGNEPWLSELKQFIRTIHQFLQEKYVRKEIKPFFAALLAGGHYQRAYDLLNERFTVAL